jgi:hypothetical protein
MPIEHVGHFTGTEESEESHDEGDGEEDEVRDGEEEEGEPGRLHRVQGRIVRLRHSTQPTWETKIIEEQVGATDCGDDDIS